MLDSHAFIAARKAKGLSQTELATAAKVSQQLVASIETGVTQRTKFLVRIAVALGVPGSVSLASQRDLPLHSSVEGGAGFIIVTRDAVDWLPRPPPVAHVRRAY